MHEIEHIQRGDWLMQIVARTVAALYWFHPLVWTAWRRLCLEAERSCDDAVVLSEERTDYANSS
jgi:beta-lactamase regulating signal transducer with metallopeptidase domain